MNRPAYGRRMFAAAGMAIGLLSGYTLAHATDPAPVEACQAAVEMADQSFPVLEKVAYALHLRATRGQAEYGEHDSAVKRLWREQDALMADYRPERDECLGVAR